MLTGAPGMLSQNLIPDSSFEMNKFVPMEFSMINASNYWSMPTRGTSDLFCKCDRKTKMLADKAYSQVDVPQNPMGYQFPNSGKCYAGIFAHAHGEYREYLQTALTRPLEKDKTYLFSMHVSLSDYSSAYIDQLGVCFVNGKSAYLNTDILSVLEPLYIKIGDEVGNEVRYWHYISTEYKAHGGESYVLFGSFEITKLEKTGFKPPEEIRSRINQSTERDAYYYIDDVSLVEIYPDAPDESGEQEEEIEATVDEILTDSVFTLKNVLFETNKSALLDSSLPELNFLAGYLKNNLQAHLTVVGHTDNSGNEASNSKLSEDRAKTVCGYLVSRGIDGERIGYKGAGSTKPIATNETEEGRQQNRRVEFIMRQN
jgi:OmpA-OmpF porin, OOP family